MRFLKAVLKRLTLTIPVRRLFLRSIRRDHRVKMFVVSRRDIPQHYRTVCYLHAVSLMTSRLKYTKRCARWDPDVNIIVPLLTDDHHSLRELQHYLKGTLGWSVASWETPYGVGAFAFIAGDEEAITIIDNLTIA